MDEKKERVGLIPYIKSILLKPFEILLSPEALRAYLSTLLAVTAALILLGIAITAYLLFYWSYIPPIGFERPIYLQFDNVFPTEDTRYDGAGNPHGSVSLLGDVISGQRYDVLVELSLPRTPNNRNAGNFMLEAIMYAPGSVFDPLKDTLVPGVVEEDNQLAKSRRPAILSYRSAVVEQLYKLTELHWYLLGWRQEAEKLKVSMFEGVEFAKGWRNVPATMTLHVQSASRMQIYSAKAVFRARFRGLRWVMYNHRIISAFVLVSAFWTTEMLFAGLAWAALSVYLFPAAQEVKAEEMHEAAERVKEEGEDDDAEAVLSDTERTFPTSSKQPPLRYESPYIKQEDDEEAVILPENVSKATEADDEDDEDEDADVFIDSGLGTSMESSSGRRDSVRRRRGRLGPGDGAK